MRITRFSYGFWCLLVGFWFFLRLELPEKIKRKILSRHIHVFRNYIVARSLHVVVILYAHEQQRRKKRNKSVLSRNGFVVALKMNKKYQNFRRFCSESEIRLDVRRCGWPADIAHRQNDDGVSCEIHVSANTRFHDI